ncbi:protein of unassigned function [Methylobacterium oryzae CBMB20]|uniref:Protein of unassigned function n=1 Tax=Methylobacterium oryzae CBMB20 TaxID=693986 RepID=A0A089NX38_9HYPH|nr:protein of unassigned function [Methylobacterium oryzae CBMB20]
MKPAAIRADGAAGRTGRPSGADPGLGDLIVREANPPGPFRLWNSRRHHTRARDPGRVPRTGQQSPQRGGGGGPPRRDEEAADDGHRHDEEMLEHICVMGGFPRARGPARGPEGAVRGRGTGTADRPAGRRGEGRVPVTRVAPGSPNGVAMAAAPHLRSASDPHLIARPHPDLSPAEGAGCAGTLMPHGIADPPHRRPKAGLGGGRRGGCAGWSRSVSAACCELRLPIREEFPKLLGGHLSILVGVDRVEETLMDSRHFVERERTVPVRIRNREHHPHSEAAGHHPVHHVVHHATHAAMAQSSHAAHHAPPHHAGSVGRGGWVRRVLRAR